MYFLEMELVIRFSKPKDEIVQAVGAAKRVAKHFFIDPLFLTSGVWRGCCCRSCFSSTSNASRCTQVDVVTALFAGCMTPGQYIPHKLDYFFKPRFSNRRTKDGYSRKLQLIYKQYTLT